MDIDLCVRIWHILRPYLDPSEIENAAYDFVNMIIDSGISAEELLLFADDNDIKMIIYEFLESTGNGYSDESEY